MLFSHKIYLQEYYKEKSILRVYKNVIARLLATLDDQEEYSRSAFTNSEETHFSPSRSRDHISPDRLQKISALAKDVVDFERRLASASLDL